MSSKKDEQIDLYIAAITTRAPSKRQIKPVSKESFQLFEDFESGSDESFVLNSEEESEENDDVKGNDSEEEDDEKDDNDENEDEDENQSNDDQNNEIKNNDNSDIISGTTDVVVNLGMRCSDNETPEVPNLIKCKLDTVMICMMCLLDVTYSDNEIIECDGCGVVVHEDCYKICDNVFMSCDNSDSSTDPWFCDACLNNVHDPRCELCPVEGGVFKRTENNCWVHLQCALYTPGVAFNDVDCLTEITLSELPLKEWAGRECCICTNPFYAKTGVCISCDAGLCKNFFHVLCAQKEGLLSEPNLEENPDDPYFAQCQQHTDKETAKRRRKSWVAALNRQKLRLEAWNNSSHFSDARMLRKLEYFSSLYQRVRELAPTPFVSVTKVPCYLETNPVAVYLFRKKAINLRLSQDVFNSYTSTDFKIGNGVPVFSPDFINYFLDREKKIDDLSKEIVRLESHHRDMQITEQSTSHQFNKVMAKKEEIMKEYTTNWDRLNTISCILKHLKKLPDLTKTVNKLLARFPESGSDNANVLDQTDNNGDNDTVNNNDHVHNGIRKRDSVINECCKCKGFSDQHLMIDCDDCFKFFHLSCLEPPLLRMPKKTKLYGWQCSNCGQFSSEENRRPKVDVNCPRQLRKLADVTSLYKRPDNRSSSLTTTNRLLQHSKNIANKIKKHHLLKRPVVLVCKVEDVIKKMESNDTDAAPTESLGPEEDDSKEDVVKKPTILDDSSNAVSDRINGPAIDIPVQRRSDRPKKRPLTLLDEFESPICAKRPKYSKVLMLKSSSTTTSPSHRKSVRSMKSKSIRKSSLIMNSPSIRKSSLIMNSPSVRKKSLIMNSPSIRKSSLIMNSSSIRKSSLIMNSSSIRKSSKSLPLRKKHRISYMAPNISIKEEKEICQSIHSNEDSDVKRLKQAIIFFPSSERLDENRQSPESEEEVQIGVVAKKPLIGSREVGMTGILSSKIVDKKPVLIKWYGDQDDQSNERISKSDSSAPIDNNRRSL